MKRYGKYIKPYLPYFILGPLCMIVEVAGEAIMPKLLANIINQAEANQLTVPSSIGTMALMILCAVLMMLGGVGGAYFGAKASVNFASDVRRDTFRKIQTFSFSNIDKFSTGSLVTRLTNDITQLQNFVNMLLRMALRAPGMMIGGLVMAILLQPKLSIVFAVAIPVLLLTIAGIVSVGFSKFAKMQTKVDELNSNVGENITNIRVVKSFVREKFETEKFNQSNANLKTVGISAMKLMIFIMPVMNLVMYSAIIAVIWFGGNIVLDGGMPLGDLSAFITYVTQILSSLMMVAMLFMSSSRAMASGRRVMEVLEEDVDIADGESIREDLRVTRGEIEFCGVSFRYYKNNDEKVLDNISLHIPACSTVGIIGSTGCGKTTLVSLIPRLYDVDEGQILIDGVDVRDYSLVSLRGDIGMVLQKNVLFSGTISENLRWGDEDASQDELERFASYAAADRFISSFGDGYETELSQGGSNLSGGQKQRLCIARALLKKPKIIILDDSTSAVDTATERQIQSAFATELSNCTKIIIAQRINSVQNADMIVVMDDGIISGIGTHSELLISNETYREIYQSQVGAKEE